MGLVAMSPIDLSVRQFSRVGFLPASGSTEVKWIRSDRLTHPPPRMSNSNVQGGTERARALIVIVLTLGCTVLSFFDLFLLAAGS
jgi:hypothetical protein